MHQQFDGLVTGGVAGRDVHHHSNPIGSSTVHLNLYLGELEAGVVVSALTVPVPLAAVSTVWPK